MKKIPLTQGKVALISDKDYKLVRKFKWHASESRINLWYARSRLSRIPNTNSSRVIMMHRLILGIVDKPNLQVDHKNLNGLDNRRHNLRLASTSQNMANRRKYKNNTSGYKGVYKVGRKWYARIKVAYKWIHLGSFTTRQRGALAYSKAAEKYFGSFARA